MNNGPAYLFGTVSKDNLRQIVELLSDGAISGTGSSGDPWKIEVTEKRMQILDGLNTKQKFIPEARRAYFCGPCGRRLRAHVKPPCKCSSIERWGHLVLVDGSLTREEQDVLLDQEEDRRVEYRRRNGVGIKPEAIAQ